MIPTLLTATSVFIIAFIAAPPVDSIFGVPTSFKTCLRNWVDCENWQFF
jgi:hypothetical protein